MIKFRCLRCAQKLAIDDEGVGLVISCTTCMEQMIVPFRSTPEFQPEPVDASAAIPATVLPADRDRYGRVEQVEPRVPETALAEVRAGMIPHLARMMMNRLVQALISQRAHLMNTQEQGTGRIEEMEQRLAKVQAQFEQRVRVYQERIEQLKQDLAVKEQENLELMRTNFKLARQNVEPEKVGAATQWTPIDLKARVRFLV